MDSQASFHDRAKHYYIIIQAAQQINARREVLATLTDYAALLVEFEHTTHAANLLAYVMNHPDVSFDIYDRADDLFIHLESTLCPRVIMDAREDARSLTLRGAVQAAFSLLMDGEDGGDIEAE